MAGGHRRTDLPDGIARGGSRLVWVSESGHVVGEDHPAAVLSDAQVDEMRDLHEDQRWGYKRLARRFRCSPSTVRAIVTYRHRVATRVRCRRVHGSQGGEG